MSFAIVLTKSFKRTAKPLVKRFASFEQDLAALGEELLTNPQAGEPLGRDCYKVRVRIESKVGLTQKAFVIASEARQSHPNDWRGCRSGAIASLCSQ